MMIWPGIFLNEKVLISAFALSFITQFLRSIYGTSSFVTVLLGFALSESESYMHSNSLSVSTVL